MSQTVFKTINQPIKFRVWDKGLRKFLNSSNRNIEFLKTYLDCIDQSDHGAASFSIIESEIVLQQFAGFSDITNQEVYEGDIVEFHSGYPNQNDNSFYKSKAAVEFKNGAFWPRPIYDHNDDDTWYNYELKDLKVIGNIFENPNLLK